MAAVIMAWRSAPRCKSSFRSMTALPPMALLVRMGAALFGEAVLLVDRDLLGHLEPGQGGYNATTGFEGYIPVNPWDMVIALEGTLFGAAASRGGSIVSRMRPQFVSFSFNLSRAGSGQLSSSDRGWDPGELWCPLWDRPVGVTGVSALFREGRLTVGKRAARTGLDAAFAVRTLGLSRGIRTFIRVGLSQSDASSLTHGAAWTV